jgi:hypothetical protein
VGTCLGWNGSAAPGWTLGCPGAMGANGSAGEGGGGDGMPKAVAVATGGGVLPSDGPAPGQPLPGDGVGGLDRLGELAGMGDGCPAGALAIWLGWPLCPGGRIAGRITVTAPMD